MVMDEETKEAGEEIVQKMIGKISDFVTRVHRARGGSNAQGGI
jgi:hypothetical protein